MKYRIIAYKHLYYTNYVLQVEKKVWFGLLPSRFESIDNYRTKAEAEYALDFYMSDKVEVILEIEV